uniref:Uncharacterized protein n=1 Tax=Parascaris univalens TaxID=6257 RepID=A0A915BM57_PARUN
MPQSASFNVRAFCEIFTLKCHHHPQMGNASEFRQHSKFIAHTHIGDSYILKDYSYETILEIYAYIHNTYILNTVSSFKPKKFIKIPSSHLSPSTKIPYVIRSPLPPLFLHFKRKL